MSEKDKYLKYVSFYKRRSIRVTWLISYLLILLIPIATSTVIYIQTINTLEQEINRANESILIQVQREVDSKLRDVKRICYELSLDNSVIKAANLPAPEKDEEMYQLVNFARELKIFKAGNEFIDGLYLYYKKMDTLWGPNARISLEEYDNHVQDYLGMGYEETREFLSSVTSTSVRVVKGASNRSMLDRSIVYATPISDVSLNTADIIAIIVVRETALLNNIQKNPSVANGEFVVINRHGDIMASSSQDKESIAFKYDDFPGLQGMIHLEHKGEENIATYISSQVLDWKYILVTPKKVFWEKSDYVRNFTYISFLLCMVIAGFATYILLRRNYSSVNSLIHMIAEKLSIPLQKKYNEYNFIEDALTYTINENKENSVKLRQQSSIIRENLLVKLLKGRFNEIAAISEPLSALDVNIESGRFLVMAFYIDDYGKLFTPPEMNQEDGMRLAEFIIRNVTEEMINRNNQCFMVEVDNIIACLISIKVTSEENSMETLLVAVKEAQDFIKEKFSICFTVAVSNIHDAANQIPRAYAECMEALEHRMVMGSGKIISYKNVAGSQNKNQGYSYYYPMLLEQQLINFIKTGDFAGAIAIVEEVLRSNFEEGARSIQLAKCVMFNLAGTILKTINDLSVHYQSNILEDSNPAEGLLGCETVSEMEDEIAGILKIVCHFVQERRKKENTGFYERVRDYISKNYKDINLSVGAIGEYFDMTPAYVSKLYKDQTGEPLLDYMNKIRIQKAKELLSSEKYTIQEVADRVGYNDVKTFTRYFKRYEGVTPGKLKGMG